MMKTLCVLAAAALCAIGAAQDKTPPTNPPAKPAAPETPATPAKPVAPAPKPDDKATAPVFVLFNTDQGDVVLQLDPVRAPITVKNFVEYVESGFYNGTIIHRSMPNFVIQGGGFDSAYTAKKPRAAIKNECSNGVKNTKGTISMARLQDGLDTATSQFFINLKDNTDLDLDGRCYAVFGKVVRGMDVVEKIALIRTGPRTFTSETGQAQRMRDVPVEPIIITKAKQITAEEAATPAAPNTGATPPKTSGATKGGSAPMAASATAPPAVQAARKFLHGLSFQSKDEIQSVTVVREGMDSLWAGSGLQIAPAIAQHLESDLANLTYQEMAVGDVVEFKIKHPFTLTATEVNESSKVIQFTYPQGLKNVFIVVKVGDDWKVDPKTLLGSNS